MRVHRPRMYLRTPARRNVHCAWEHIGRVEYRVCGLQWKSASGLTEHQTLYRLGCSAALFSSPILSPMSSLQWLTWSQPLVSSNIHMKSWHNLLFSRWGVIWTTCLGASVPSSSPDTSSYWHGRCILLTGTLAWRNPLLNFGEVSVCRLRQFASDWLISNSYHCCMIWKTTVYLFHKDYIVF